MKPAYSVLRSKGFENVAYIDHTSIKGNIWSVIVKQMYLPQSGYLQTWIWH